MLICFVFSFNHSPEFGYYLVVLKRTSLYFLPPITHPQVKHYDRIALFYKELHEKQTVEYVLKKRAEYAPLNKRVMTIWEVRFAAHL